MAIELDPAEVERLAGEGLAGYQVAQALGISYDTLARRMDSDAEIADALKRGQMSAIGKVENALYESAVKGNLGAQVFYLKNRASDRWKDKTEQVTTLHTTPAEVLDDDFLATVAAGSSTRATVKTAGKALAH